MKETDTIFAVSFHVFLILDDFIMNLDPFVRLVRSALYHFGEVRL